ncbi:MAG: hypothetical protein WC291_09105 [Thermodesulfovibrionales bacterium]
MPLQRGILHWLAAILLLFVSSLQAQAWQPPLRTVPKTDLTDVAVAGYAGDEPVIFFNPQYMQWLGSVSSAFFFAHEYGHHHLGHLKGLAEVMKKEPQSMIRIRQEYEMEADCYAAALLAREAPQAVEAIITLFETAQGEGRIDWLHPSGYERADLIRSCASKALSAGAGEDTDFPAGDPEASRYVTLTQSDARRDASRLLFTYRCKNTGHRPVRCSVLVGLPDEKEAISVVSKFVFELFPGDVRTIHGNLAATGERTTALDLSARLSCEFIGPELPEPKKISASHFLSFAGLRSGDGASEVVARFGMVMPRHGRFMSYLDYFNGSMSIGCNRSTKKVVTVDVVGLDGVKALKGLGINDPKLDFIGKSREYVLKALGDPSPDPNATEFSRDADGVSVIFSCYGAECSQITVRWAGR